MAEQRRIADILDRADALRAKRREAIALFDDLTQSIFLDMFGDPSANGRSLPVLPFASVCRRVTVGVVVKPASYYVYSGVPALRSLNVKAGWLKLDDLVYFSAEDNDGPLAKSRLRIGDLVIVRTGQPGATAVVPPELDGANAIDIIIASADVNQILPEFLAAQINTPGTRAALLREERGQIQQHLNVGSLNKALVVVSPMVEQIDFLDRLAAVHEVQDAAKTHVIEAEALFATLQWRAFVGEL